MYKDLPIVQCSYCSLIERKQFIQMRVHYSAYLFHILCLCNSDIIMNVVTGYSSCLITKSFPHFWPLPRDWSLAVLRHHLRVYHHHSMAASLLPHPASWAPPLRLWVVDEDGINTCIFQHVVDVDGFNTCIRGSITSWIMSWQHTFTNTIDYII